MPSTENMLNKVTKLDSDYITVHYERCCLVRNHNADCLKCASVCTSGCISWDGEQLTLDPTKCIGCGTCASVCPDCCLEAHHPNDAELLAQCRALARRNAGEVVIACGEQLDADGAVYDPERVVRVECMGRVEETLLTTLVADGVESITLVCGDCESCEHETGWEVTQQVQETMAQLMRAWRRDADIRIVRELPDSVTKGPGAVSNESRPKPAPGARVTHKAEVAPPEYLKVMEDGTLPHFVPDRRERLLDALARLGEPDDTTVNSRLWGHVVIDTDVCISCRMCAVFCPTGALRKFDREDGTFGVEHYPGDCVKCRVCTNICPAGALRLSDEVRARDMLAGMTDAYEMNPLGVERSGPHTILNMAKTFTGGTQVYER